MAKLARLMGKLQLQTDQLETVRRLEQPSAPRSPYR